MSTDRPVLQVLVASTRPGRVGEPVARWIARRAGEHAAFDVEVVDLAEIDLPMFAEPRHPRLGQYAHEHTRAFSATISRADGFVLVFPEYNHSYNAALKNALDHLHREWAGKPVGLVSYGGVAAGARAAVALQPVLLALRMRPVAAAPIPFVSRYVEGEGDERRFAPDAEVEKGIDAVLDALSAELGRG
ncbi:NADPH-dependent FMN reductase [Pseudonocardia lacus]|uniref:NADPH-dependent FMN reductase n=1 Tax=Pseudonocardia lacus TaxID=2835865 RepID=UPI001BDBE873|nr:NAD(P)H-dependent oxidoreductase [Pseudonocardia lacus]